MSLLHQNQTNISQNIMFAGLKHLNIDLCSSNVFWVRSRIFLKFLQCHSFTLETMDSDLFFSRDALGDLNQNRPIF